MNSFTRPNPRPNSSEHASEAMTARASVSSASIASSPAVALTGTATTLGNSIATLLGGFRLLAEIQSCPDDEQDHAPGLKRKHDLLLH